MRVQGTVGLTFYYTLNTYIYEYINIISHINTQSKVTGHVGNDQLKDAIIGSDVVVM